MTNQPNLQAILYAVKDHYSEDALQGRYELSAEEAIDAIYATGLSAIGEDEDYRGNQSPVNEVKAEQRKAWQRVCYGDEK